MQINDPVAFLIFGSENSAFCDLNKKLENFTREQNCILNICCHVEKVEKFIEKLQQNNVKVANNCIVLDDSLEQELSRALILALKRSYAFCFLPIIVFTVEHNLAMIDFCYHNYVSAVIRKPLQEENFLQIFKETIIYFRQIARLPTFAVMKEETGLF